jgi:mitochondrial import inner membrane translocase subunit TIM23
MSVWDVFTGKKSSKPSTETIASTPTTNFSSAPFDPTSAQDVSSFLGSASLPDASQLHPLAGLNQQSLDYLTLDESTLTDLPGSRSALPSRGWSDDLCYGTGVTYLTALSIGGAWGLIEGLNRAPASAPPKLRLNSVLNSVTRRGPFLGNSAGVVAMVYNGFNSIIGHYRGKHDSANSIVAGALSGMLFKSTRGLKPMAISGGIVATVAGIWAVRTRIMTFKRVRLLTSVPGHQKSPLLTVHFALLNLPIRLLSRAEPLQTAGQQLLLLLESPFFHVLDTIVVLAVLGRWEDLLSSASLHGGGLFMGARS